MVHTMSSSSAQRKKAANGRSSFPLSRPRLKHSGAGSSAPSPTRGEGKAAASRKQRIRLVGIDAEYLDRAGHVLGRELAVRGQRGDGGLGDVETIDLEMPAQVRAGVAAAVAVGAEHAVAH